MSTPNRRPRYDLQRPPPCWRCGAVEPASAFDTPHKCNPTLVQAMQLGAENVERIGRAILNALAALNLKDET